MEWTVQKSAEVVVNLGTSRKKNGGLTKGKKDRMLKRTNHCKRL